MLLIMSSLEIDLPLQIHQALQNPCRTGRTSSAVMKALSSTSATTWRTWSTFLRSTLQLNKVTMPSFPRAESSVMAYPSWRNLSAMAEPR